MYLDIVLPNLLFDICSFCHLSLSLPLSLLLSLNDLPKYVTNSIFEIYCREKMHKFNSFLCCSTGAENLIFRVKKNFFELLQAYRVENISHPEILVQWNLSCVINIM